MDCGTFILLLDLAVVIAIAGYWLYKEHKSKRDN